MPDPISPTSGASAPVDLNTLLGGPAADQIAKTKATDTYFDKDMFLRLLTTQLRYQDPSKPMDSSEFMAQAAQLASVEQMQALVKSQQESASMQKSLTGAALVGKVVSGLDAQGQQVEGVCTRVLISATGVSVVLGEQLQIPFSNVTAVADASTAAGAAAPSTP